MTKIFSILKKITLPFYLMDKLINKKNKKGEGPIISI
jgi:hypothetical protein